MDEAQVADVAAAPEAVAAEPEVQSNDAPQEAAPVETPPPVQEKMIPQSQLDKLIAREKRQAAEKARSETIAEFERQNVAKDTAQPVQNMGGIPQIPQEQLEQHIMAAARRMSVQMTADQMAKDFETKIQAEIQADPDFGDAYDQLKIAQHPELVIWMNGMDNSAKVVKDLAHNPSKYAHILMLAKSGMPELAQRELTKLHESIKANQAALAQPKVKEPLDQLSPTNVGGSGEKSVSDFQKEPWLRG